MTLAFFISLATSAALFAFQQVGYLPDASFSLLQAFDVNHDAVSLPRLALFKYLRSSESFDVKSLSFLRCQSHSNVFFIEYNELWPQSDEDWCKNVTPILLQRISSEGSSAYYDEEHMRRGRAEAGIESESDLSFIQRSDELMQKISRCVVINTLDRTVSLVSGFPQSDTDTQDDAVKWYIGADETYSHLVIGSHHVPYSPINNNHSRPSNHTEFPFFLDPVYLPVGSVLTLDAALFAPMEHIAEFYNTYRGYRRKSSHSRMCEADKSDDVETRSRSQAAHPSPQRSAESGRGVDICEEPKMWQLMHSFSLRTRHTSEGPAGKNSVLQRCRYSNSGGGLRSKHWVNMCSSLATALQPLLIQRSQRDRSLSQDYDHEAGDYRYAYFARPFVTTAGSAVTPESTTGRLLYWLDLCGLQPPLANTLSSLGGPQLPKFESRLKRGRRRRVREVGGYPPGATLSSSQHWSHIEHPHDSPSPYSTQAACDINYVKNLRNKTEFAKRQGKSAISHEKRISELLCMEDFILHEALVESVDLSAAASGNETAFADVKQRLPSDWSVYASSRGLADLWFSDPGLGRHRSIYENPYASTSDYFLLQEMRLFEQRYELSVREKLRAQGRSADGNDHKINASDPSFGEEGGRTFRGEPHEWPFEHPADAEETVTSHIRAATASLISARKEEFNGLLRIVRAFSNGNIAAKETMRIRKVTDVIEKQTAQEHTPPVNKKPLEVFTEGNIIEQCTGDCTVTLDKNVERRTSHSSDDDSNSKEVKSFATRMYIKSLFRDLIFDSIGIRRSSSSSLVYSNAAKSNDYQPSRKNVKKMTARVCDLSADLLTDVPLLSDEASESAVEGRPCEVYPVNVASLRNVATSNISSVKCIPKKVKNEVEVVKAYENYLKTNMRASRNVEEYFGDALKEVLSIPSSVSPALFKSATMERLGELLVSIGASPTEASSPTARQYSVHAAKTGRGPTVDRLFRATPFSRCGTSRYIDERDYTKVALSLHNAIRQYLLPAVYEENGHLRPSMYVCAFLTNKSPLSSSSRFLTKLRYDFIKANASVGDKPHLCDPSSASNAKKAVVNVLRLFYESMSSVTQRAMDTERMKESDPLHSLLLKESMNRPALETLLAVLDELDGKNPVPSSPPYTPTATQLEDEEKASKALNLKVNSGDSHVLLFVLPKHYSLAQELVERLRKYCESNVCWIYINYHIIVTSGEGDVDDDVSADLSVSHIYDSEVDIDLDHYSRRWKEAKTPYSLNFCDQEKPMKLDDSTTESWLPPRTTKVKRPARHFDTEYSDNTEGHAGKPSLRMSLLAAADFLDKVAVRSDVVSMCIGIEDCLGMEIHGMRRSKGIPYIEYGGSALYRLPAPVTFGATLLSSDETMLANPYSIVGVAYAMKALFLQLGFYNPGNSYRYGNNADLFNAIQSYHRANSFVNTYKSENFGNSEEFPLSDWFWVGIDHSEMYFNPKRGKSLWDNIRGVDSLFISKKIHMGANRVNREHPHNAIEDIVYLVDSSNEATVEENEIIFNITYCNEVTYLHQWGPLKKHYAGPTQHRDLPAAPNRRFNPGPGIRNTLIMNSTSWLTMQSERVNCHLGKAKLLLTTFFDDYSVFADRYVQGLPDVLQNINGIKGNTNPSIFPWTAKGKAIGYTSMASEEVNMSSHRAPVSDYNNSIFRFDRDNSENKSFKKNIEEGQLYMNFFDAVQNMTRSGSIWGVVCMLIQAKRVFQLPVDRAGNFSLHDPYLQKMYELLRVIKQHQQYTPLLSYARALQHIETAIYWKEIDDMGRDALDPTDESLNADFKRSYADDTNFIPEPGYTNRKYGRRGGPLAKRYASKAEQVCDSSLYPHYCRRTVPGIGRGPFPVTEIGTTERDWQLHPTKLSAYNASIQRSAREVFGNPIAAALFAMLAGVYQITGPYTSMVETYAKSIAHTDYFSVVNRRKLWRKQRKELRKQDHTYEDVYVSNSLEHSMHSLPQKARRIKVYNSAAGKPVVHWVTMASKHSDRLHNLIYTANLAGINLNVVGMEPTNPSNGSPLRKFSYEHKVEAFHEFLQMHSRGSARNIGLTERERSQMPIADNDLVVLIDAFDVVLFPAARQLGERFRESAENPIIFCSEHGIYPEYPSAFVMQKGDAHDFFSEHSTSGKSWTSNGPSLGTKFLNSGCVIGRAAQMTTMVHAAYVNRFMFKDDQQFYVRYHLSYPDLVGIDISQKLFFTGQKQSKCDTFTVVDNDVTLKHVKYANSQPYGRITSFPRIGNVQHVIDEIGVLHANNMGNNRLYEVAVAGIAQANDMHFTGPDGPGLLSTIRACIDKDFNRAAYLLSNVVISNNFTSNGGMNLLGDLLTVKYHKDLWPAFVRMAQSEEIALMSGRSAYDEHTAHQLASLIIERSRNATETIKTEAAKQAVRGQQYFRDPLHESAWFLQGQIETFLVNEPLGCKAYEK